MTHLLTELTPDSAKPVELYDFTIPGTALSWHYTTDTRPDGIYIPEAISRSNVKRTLAEPSSDMTIEVGDENPFALQLMAGLTSRPVEVQVRQYHRGDGEMVNVFVGYAAGVSFDGPKATVTCLPRLAVASRRRVPWQTYQAGCNWQWSSPGCGVNRQTFKRGPYTLAAGVPGANSQAVTVNNLIMLIGGSHADGDLSNGWVERVSDGDTRFIEQNIGGTLTLQSPFPNPVIGESFVVYPGCRRTEEDCEKRFNNLVHFLGWPRLPTLNPFNRSAFYLAGAAAAVPQAPPTTTVTDPTTGSGYSLDLSTQKVRVKFSSGGGTGVLRTNGVLTFSTDGFVRFQAGPTTAAFPVNFVNPRPCPASVTAGLDVFVESEGLGPLNPNPVGACTVSSIVSGFDAWLPLSANQSAIFEIALGSQQNAGGGANDIFYARRFVVVKIRVRATGVIVASGTLDVGFYGERSGLRSGGGGGYPPSGW
jgi:Phage conserved hypothetical protein BR0599